MLCGRTLLALWVLAFALAGVARAAAPEFHPDELGPGGETAWELPASPAVQSMQTTIRDVLRGCETQFWGGYGEPVQGFIAGRDYPMIFIRDTSTLLQTASYFYSGDRLASAVEEFMRRQYGPDTRSDEDGFAAGDGAISAVVAPDGHIDKATAVSDEELHLIHAAYIYFRTGGGAEWLHRSLRGRAIIDRLNAAMTWLCTNRTDPATGLVRRAHTTDWGDVKMEPARNPTDIDPDHDVWTASVYDQALAHRGLLELAEMSAAAGDGRADEWRERATALRERVQQLMWQPDRGFFLTHLHLTPFEHPFEESTMVSIANAVAVRCGLANAAQAAAIFDQLEQVRQAAGATKPGIVLYPPYPAGTFAAPQMAPGRYQNGGLWDWWAGWQVLAEFEWGVSELAWAHLQALADDWQRHPGIVWEWQTAPSNEGHGPDDYAGAAGTVGEAIVAGLFGVRLDGQGLSLTPRLAEQEGLVRVVQPASGRYAAYRYTPAPDALYMDYGTDAGDAQLSVLLPSGSDVTEAVLDGRTVEFARQTLGRDRYVVVQGPSGVHRLELRRR